MVGTVTYCPDNTTDCSVISSGVPSYSAAYSPNTLNTFAFRLVSLPHPFFDNYQSELPSIDITMDQTETTTPKKMVSIASLLSPPETMRHDSFTSAGHSMATDSFASVAPSAEALQAATQTTQATLGPETVYPSPPTPISPQHVDQQEKPFKGNEGIKDPPAYAASEAGESIAQMPLFPSDVAVEYDAESAIARHVGVRDGQSPSGPTKEDYEAALTITKLKTSMMDLFNKDPKAWWKREISLWPQYEAERQKKLQRQAEKRKQQMLLPREPLRRVASTSRVKKPRQPLTPRAQPQRTPRQIAAMSFRNPFEGIGIQQYTPPASAPRAPRPPVVRGEFDWRSIPDFSPPISTLPDGKYSLKTDWKGQPLDLSNDPDRDNLHPDELRLASTLRLQCAAYLHSKRNIFKARLEKLRMGKEFRKTDAQQACSIDVNKASKLWTAYDKVGWFNPQYMASHL